MLCGAGFSGNNYWSSEQQSSGNHYNVNLNNGNINNNDSNTNNVVCRQGVLATFAAALSGYSLLPG
ncbi:hypothetical protein [Enterobacter sp. SLBN-59]|uniref:hypothetical protein n=1 Tax=Enterobacter sp. SLBN-59 TaxID=2940621 RepID=UPI002169EEA0|nr:hypothetical protein [Enterobacter sp. SLBN-59]MCS3491022.1 hypothetical protein [Enterobacter sp. SLBN-59]